MADQYAVMIDVDGDWMYVPVNASVFHNYPKPKLFDYVDDARAEAEKWNTGVVCKYPSGHIIPKKG